MLITLFTDASFNKALHKGVWAIWAKANGKTIRHSGPIRNSIPDIAEGELSAIANGLFFIKKDFAPERGSQVLVTCDSMEAINSLRLRSHPRVTCRHLTNYIWAFSREQDWTLGIRHVNGHKGTMTPRHAVNTWCDKECRRLMGELLKAHKEANQPELPLCQVVS